MILLITKDKLAKQFIRYQRSDENAQDLAAWGTLTDMTTSPNALTVSKNIVAELRKLGPDEPLCFIGHGLDNYIGGDGGDSDAMGWNPGGMSIMLEMGLPENWQANKVLFYSCGESDENFSYLTASFLSSLNRADIECYGYTANVPFQNPIPSPDNIMESANIRKDVSMSQEEWKNRFAAPAQPEEEMEDETQEDIPIPTASRRTTRAMAKEQSKPKTNDIESEEEMDDLNSL